jgi:hypothetical protein
MLDSTYTIIKIYPVGKDARERSDGGKIPTQLTMVGRAALARSAEVETLTWLNHP